MNLNLSRFRLAAWLCALFTVVVGAKLWIVQAYGTAIPFWDQWDEAKLFFKPWLEGHLTWGAWFAAHNEHRIFFTRALDLLVVRLNHQWDPMLQMTINAFIHAGYACGLAYCLWIFSGRKNEGLICFLLVPFFALPYAAENTIHGFQSQMYFLSIFSVATIIGLGFGSPGNRWWFLGLAAGIMSIFTMGSGLLASLTVTGLVVLRILKLRGVTRSHLITLGCSLVIFIFGLTLNVTVEQDKQFQAKSLLIFLNALMGNLAWPFSDHPVMLFFICLPLLITANKYFRSGFKDPRAAEFILALGLWGFLQSAALAYGRAGEVCSRYMDALGTIPIASVGSLFILGKDTELRRLSRRSVTMLMILWVGIVFLKLGKISRTTIGDYKSVENYLQWSRMWGLVEEDNVRAFVATGDTNYLSNKPLLAIPYWNSAWLIDLLRDPKLSAIMPPDCRAPLKLEKDEKSDASFVLDGYPPENPKQEFTQVWGDYSTNTANASGLFVSKPISATLPKLIVPVCCGTNLQGIQLQLVEQKTERKIELHPEIVGRWRALVVSAPQNPFRLEITGQNHDSWVAVGEIQEMGCLSYCALLLLNHAVAVLLAGLCLFVCAAGFGLLHRQKIIFSDGSFAEFFILLTGLAAVACVWSARNFDATELSGKLQKNWALYFASAGDPPSVEMHLREALWLQPDDPEALNTLADVILHDPGLEKNKAREQAVLYYEEALRLRPDYAEARQHLNKTLSELGLKDAHGN
jgi:tetratricopeptide (TPR) repeat protein